MSYEQKVKRVGSTPNKKIINSFIADVCFQGNSCKALVMDGPSYGTAKTLHRRGVPPRNIVSFGREIPDRNKASFKTIRGSSSDVLNHYQGQSFKVVYLDYMTNKMTDCEIDDIEKACDMIGKGGVLLFTLSLCVRNSGQPDIVRENVVQTVRDSLHRRGLKTVEKNYREPGKVNGMKLVVVTSTQTLFDSALKMVSRLAVCSTAITTVPQAAHEFDRADLTVGTRVLVHWQKRNQWPAIITKREKHYSTVKWEHWPKKSLSRCRNSLIEKLPRSQKFKTEARKGKISLFMC